MTQEVAIVKAINALKAAGEREGEDNEYQEAITLLKEKAELSLTMDDIPWDRETHEFSCAHSTYDNENYLMLTPANPDTITCFSNGVVTGIPRSWLVPIPHTKLEVPEFLSNTDKEDMEERPVFPQFRRSKK